jgi:hypothetical protein
MITFRWKSQGIVESVFLEGKKVGHIKMVEKGWQYFPLHARTGGEVFEKRLDCKQSLLEN